MGFLKLVQNGFPVVSFTTKAVECSIYILSTMNYFLFKMIFPLTGKYVLKIEMYHITCPEHWHFENKRLTGN